MDRYYELSTREHLSAFPTGEACGGQSGVAQACNPGFPRRFEAKHDGEVQVSALFTSSKSSD